MLFLLKFTGFINDKLAKLLQNKANNSFLLCNYVKKKNKQLLTADSMYSLHISCGFYLMN